MQGRPPRPPPVAWKKAQSKGHSFTAHVWRNPRQTSLFVIPLVWPWVLFPFVRHKSAKWGTGADGRETSLKSSSLPHAWLQLTCEITHPLKWLQVGLCIYFIAQWKLFLALILLICLAMQCGWKLHKFVSGVWRQNGCQKRFRRRSRQSRSGDANDLSDWRNIIREADQNEQTS